MHDDGKPDPGCYKCSPRFAYRQRIAQDTIPFTPPAKLHELAGIELFHCSSGRVLLI